MLTVMRDGDSLDRRLSRVLTTIVLVEGAAYALIFWFAQLSTAFAVCLSAAIGWRLLMFLGSFPIAWLVGDGRGGFMDWLRAMRSELSAMARAYCFDQFNVQGAVQSAAGTNRPVLLIHGFFCNAGIFATLIRALGDRPARAINLDPLYWSIEDNARRLKVEIEAFSQANGNQRVVLLAHSMGGVCARYLLAHEHDLPVHGLVTIGAPHRGTRLAVTLPGGSERGPTRPATRWLAESNLKQLAANCHLLAVMSWQDNIVVPQSSALVPDAPELELNGVGHVALLYDSTVRKRLLTILQNWA